MSTKQYGQTRHTKLEDDSYRNYARLLLSDIYLSKRNNNIAYKNYLKLRSNLKDSTLINDVDKRIILCISNGLKENILESIFMKEKNSENRSIINLSRAYQSWLNGDNYNLLNALNGVNKIYLNNKYIFFSFNNPFL